MSAAEQIEGSWINQHGSVLELRCDMGGQLSGNYRTAKGRAAAGKHYPLIGQLNGEVFAFQVNWIDGSENLAAITSFSGRLGWDPEGQPCLHTMWVLARQFEDAERTRATGVWNAFLTNADVFTRLESYETEDTET